MPEEELEDHSGLWHCQSWQRMSHCVPLKCFWVCRCSLVWLNLRNINMYIYALHVLKKWKNDKLIQRCSWIRIPQGTGLGFITSCHAPKHNLGPQYLDCDTDRIRQFPFSKVYFLMCFLESIILVVVIYNQLNHIISIYIIYTFWLWK